MPRQLVQEPNRLSLQVVASPTDQFALPEVRQGQFAAGSQAAQIAHSLRDFSPVLAQAAEQRAEAERRQQEIRAMGDITELRAKNKIDFQQAVKEGLISETDNPWYLESLKAGLAQASAEKIMRDAWGQYQNDPLRLKLDASPDEVSQFFASRVGQGIEGWDEFQKASAQQTFAAHLGAYLNEDVANRARLRETTSSELFGNQVQSLLSGVDSQSVANADSTFLDEGATPDPASTQAVDATTAQLQAVLDTQRETQLEPKANKTVLDVVANEALRRSDWEFAHAMLSRLKDSQGNPLADSAEAKAALEELQGEVIRKQAQETSQEDSLKAHQVRSQVETSMGWFQTELAKRRATDPQAKLSEIKMPLSMMQSLLPAAWEEVESRRAALVSQEQAGIQGGKEDAKASILKELYGPGLQGQPDPHKEIDLLTHLALIGGEQEANSYLSLRDHIARSQEPQETDPQVLMGIMDDLQAAGGDPKALEGVRHTLIQQKMAGRLTPGNFEHFLPLTYRQPQDSQEDTELSQSLGQLVTAGFVDSSGDDRKDLEGNEEFLRRLSASRMAFSQESEALRRDPSYLKLGVTERREKMLGLVDAVSQRYGGVTRQGLLKKAEAPQPTTQPSPKVQSAFISPEATANPTVAKVAQVDPTIGTVDGSTLRILSWATQAQPRTVINGVPQLDPGMPQPFDDPAHFQLDTYDNPNGDIVKVWLRYRNQEKPDTQPDAAGYVKYDNGRETPVTSVRQTVQEAEIRLWRNALEKTKSLKSVIDDNGVVQHLNDLSAVLEARQKAGDLYIAPYEKRQLLIYQNLMSEYASYRTIVGAGVDEVKAMGGDAWKTIPMFANLLDLERRGDEAASKLGLKTPEQQKEFSAVQRQLMSKRPTY